MNNTSWVSHTPDKTDEPSQQQTAEDDESFQEALDYASSTAEIEQTRANAASATDAETSTKTSARSRSPPNTFEKFFLPLEGLGLDSSTFALAGRRIQKNNTSTNIHSNAYLASRRSHSNSVTASVASESVLTEDFASAADDLSEHSYLDDISIEDLGPRSSSIFNDILGQGPILEETPEDEEFDMAKRKNYKKRTNDTSTYTNTTTKTKIMSTTPVTANTPSPLVDAKPAPSTTPAPVPVPTTTEHSPKFDVIENVYEGAKTAWAFGKNIIVFKPFMGVAEGAASKVLSMTTGVSSLEDADTHIKSTLAGVDVDFIDPAILKLWSVLEPIIGKGDDVLKSVLGLASNLPMIEYGKKKEEAMTSTVETIVKESPEDISPETSTPASVFVS
mmetsp:Transcript_29468/g.34150  ORF Transcript_29468/g.34150 Transcript_29468/m.34150 type:complete len:390 (+) Transcript_29468:138-1307(+)